MIPLEGYLFTETVFEDSYAIGYRGHRLSDHLSVIAKTLKPTIFGIDKAKRIIDEYHLLRSLQLTGIITPFSLENIDQFPIMIMEDFDGIVLSKIMRNKGIGLDRLFIIAQSITRIIRDIHETNIIHKNIHPGNILINPTTNDIKIINFSNASRVLQESVPRSYLGKLEGHPAYLSPEQTGRVNRSVDFRSDLYSLGITLYEMITGLHPFDAKDSMELIHAHIAKIPVPAIDIRPEIPEMLSHIVMKLLSKSKQDRYHTASGLLSDIEKCEQQIQSNGRVKPFALGIGDIPRRQIIPEKLYGRQAETKLLLSRFRMASQGDMQAVFIIGPPGIGKSALAHEVKQTILNSHGLFIKGKFDRHKKNIPYNAFIQALEDLIRQLLIEPQHRFERWRIKIKNALGPNGRILTNVIPELELIIGEQPQVPDLEPIKLKNRFHLTLLNFIQLFADSAHPLTLFIDDWQWADMGSINFLNELLISGYNKYFLFLGAYRNDEVSQGDPFAATLGALQKKMNEFHKKKPLHFLMLNPLTQDEINRLLTDVLSPVTVDSVPLAEVIGNKTLGNPLFIFQFLQSLIQDKRLRFNLKKGQWEWDLLLIQEMNATDNVIDLMVRRVQYLPESNQHALMKAACIGRQFHINLLADIAGYKPAAILQQLMPAIESGFVVPCNNSQDTTLLTETDTTDDKGFLKFSHDRLHQAVYALIPSHKKKKIHLCIGRCVHKKIAVKTKFDDRLFEMVRHLRLSKSLIADDTEKRSFVELNLRVGLKALETGAFSTAYNYFLTGLDLLPPASWKTSYDLVLAVHVATAEAAYLCADYERLDTIIPIVLKNTDELLDKIKIYEVRLDSLKAQYRLSEAMETALPMLNLLGLNLPANPNELTVSESLLEIQAAIEGKRIKDLINLPVMKNLTLLATQRLVIKTAFVLYTTTPELLHLIIFSSVKLSIKHGNTSESAIIYAAYGFILCGALGDIETGYQFGRLALKVLKRFEAQKLQAMTYYLINGMVIHWKEPVRATLKPLMNGYISGQETGDFESAGFCGFFYCFHSLLCGRNLERVEEEMAVYSNTIFRLKSEPSMYMQEIIRQTVSNLRKPSDTPCHLSGQIYNEDQMLSRHHRTNDKTTLFVLYFVKLMLCCLFSKYKTAMEMAEMAEKFLHNVIGTYPVPLFYFFDSLARLRAYSNSAGTDQKEVLKRVNHNQKKMKKWAEMAPANHKHRFHLIKAELGRILGRENYAAEHYDRAIQLANDNEFFHEEALANELAAGFYLAKGKKKIAGIYLVEARFGYQTWGTVAKVADLNREHARLLLQIDTKINIGRQINIFESPAIHGIAADGKEEDMDVLAIMKAFETVSNETLPDELLSHLITILVENAGAQKVVLLLNREDTLYIQAEGCVGKKDVALFRPLPVNENGIVPEALIHFSTRKKEPIILDDASGNPLFSQDAYIRKHQPKSVMCIPLYYQNQLKALLYLENSLNRGSFTLKNLKTLKVLAAQIVTTTENVLLYNDLIKEIAERRKAESSLRKYHVHLKKAVSKRTAELKTSNEELQHSIIEYRKTRDALKQSVQEKESLLRELYHRTKNNMQVICSLLSLQMQNIKDDNTLSMLKDTRHRIKSMALIHEKLYQSKNLSKIDLKAYVHDLAQNLVKNNQVGGKNISLSLDLKSTPVTIDTAVPCGLIVNELMTNALKYAFPKNRKGKINIRLNLNQQDEIELQIADNGIGVPTSFDLKRAKTLGLQLVYNLTTKQLNGKIRLQLGTGMAFHLKFKEREPSVSVYERR